MKRILTIGEILVEIMAVEPGLGFRAPISLVGPYASGAPAIFIDQAGLLGQPCAIISAVGRDDFGTLCIDRLRRDGVDVSAIALDSERPTGSAFVRYRPDGTRDFVFNIKHSACASIGPSPQAEAAIAACDHLHVMGTALVSEGIVDLTMSAIAEVRKRGGTISFDPNARREMLALPGMREALESVLAEADVFLPSGPELLLFSAAETEPEAISDLLGRGVKRIVLKRGAAGAACFDAEETVSVPGRPVREVDPTGAGDCFGATFICCWLRGMPTARALALANAAGALAVLRRGPMEGASRMSDIVAFTGDETAT